MSNVLFDYMLDLEIAVEIVRTQTKRVPMGPRAQLKNVRVNFVLVHSSSRNYESSTLLMFW